MEKLSLKDAMERFVLYVTEGQHFDTSFNEFIDGSDIDIIDENGNSIND